MCLRISVPKSLDAAVSGPDAVSENQWADFFMHSVFVLIFCILVTSRMSHSISVKRA